MIRLLPDLRYIYAYKDIIPLITCAVVTIYIQFSGFKTHIISHTFMKQFVTFSYSNNSIWEIFIKLYISLCIFSSLEAQLKWMKNRKTKTVDILCNI